MADPRLQDVADALMARRRRPDSGPDEETRKDLQMADEITGPTGRRLIPENWDKFLEAQPYSENFEDRRDEPPMTKEESDFLAEQAQMDEDAGIAGIDYAAPNDPPGRMGKALGTDDLDQIIQQLLIDSSPGAQRRIRT